MCLWLKALGAELDIPLDKEIAVLVTASKSFDLYVTGSSEPFFESDKTAILGNIDINDLTYIPPADFVKLYDIHLI